MADKGIKVHIYGDYDDKDVKKAIKDLQSLQGQAGPTQKASSGIAAGFKSIALAAGAFVGLTAIKDFVGDSISQGSALEESLSKVNVVFGESADEIVAWSESSATAFGQSQAQALESVGTFGNLLQAFGSTASEAQVMSQRMVELAADLASFNNTSVEDALQAIQSGLSGEAEPLKRYGAALTDVRLKSVAMEKGLYDGKGALDVHAKSVAAYELILKDTALAQGDFARTSDGFANQTRIMQAAIDDLKAKFGVGIIEGFQQGATSGQGLASSFDSMEESASDLGKTLGYLAGEALGAAGDMAQATASVIGYKEALDDSQGEAEGLGLTIERWFASIFLWATSAEVPLKKFSTTAKNTGGIAKEAAGPVDEFGQQLSEADVAAQSAEDALKALKDQVNALKGAISDRQAVDDFRKSLRDLDETLKGNERTFKGMGDAALENRETLRTAFSDAADIVQGWVESGKISADEFDAAYAKLGSKVVNNFVKQGFTRSDIRKFLQSEGMWTAEFNKVGDYAKAAGVGIGTDLLAGIKGSLTDANNLATLRYAAMQAAQAAEGGFREESETQSPSKKWKAIGDDLIAGLIQGLDSKKDKIKSSATEAAQAVIDGANDRLAQWDETIAAYKDRYDELADYARGLSSSLFGQLDLGAAVDSAKETGGSVVDAFVEQGKAIGTFSQSMIDLLNAGLSQTAWEAVNALGAARGQQLADEMLGAQGATTIAGINQVYADVEHMANAVGELAAQKWYGEGVAQAQATYEGFKANFGEGGPARKALENLMDRLASAMNRTATITVTTINRTINQALDGVRADGGPVAAGKSYLVGERGPEVLVMGNRSGMIVPNEALPTASGTFTRGGDGAALGAPINLTVNAGMGTDGAEVGRQVVEALKAYSRRNGPLPLAVA